MPDTEGSQVIVVGAGIAGLSAALRLAERDFKVTLVEQNNFLGGKLGAHKHVEPCPDDYHEHSFHMYLNWYHNFWRIADEIGLLQHFTPAPEMNYLKPKQFVREGKPLRLINVGALASSWHNIFSGVEFPRGHADLWLFAHRPSGNAGTANDLCQYERLWVSRVAPLHDRPRDCITRANPCESIRQPDLFERGADLSEIYQLWLSASYTDDLAAERQHRDVPVQTLSRAFESTRRQDLHSEASSTKSGLMTRK